MYLAGEQARGRTVTTWKLDNGLKHSPSFLLLDKPCLRMYVVTIANDCSVPSVTQVPLASAWRYTAG
jgi:hypothetical protein